MIICIFLLLLLTVPQSANAFISPNTLAIIAASFSSVLWGIIIIISVNAVLFLKISRKYLVSIILLLLVIVVLSYFFKGYIQVGKLNIFMVKHEINLWAMTENELSEFKVFQVAAKSTVFPSIHISNAIIFDKREIMSFRGIKDLQCNIDKFILNNNIRKEDRILFCCETGISSRMIAVFFNIAGYNANFARREILFGPKLIVDHLLSPLLSIPIYTILLISVLFQYY